MTGRTAKGRPGRRWPRRSRASVGRSTGPRTRQGKAKAAGNARRHGLSLPVLADPALAPEVAALARAIAGAGASEARHAAAARIAEAQADLVRVRRLRAEVMAAVLAGREPITWLARIDRYERRAFSRRKFAIRAFACDDAHQPPP